MKKRLLKSQSVLDLLMFSLLFFLFSLLHLTRRIVWSNATPFALYYQVVEIF